jgi:hypothetical protein
VPRWWSIFAVHQWHNNWYGWMLTLGFFTSRIASHHPEDLSWLKLSWRNLLLA